jgi:hypothetical protein
MPEVKAEAWRGRWSRLRQSWSRRKMSFPRNLPSLRATQTTVLVPGGHRCHQSPRSYLSLSLSQDHDQLTTSQAICEYMYWPAQLWRSNDEVPPQFWTIEKTYPCLATRLRSRILHDAEDKKIQNPRHPRSYAVS